jgi:hypothetical protein
MNAKRLLRAVMSMTGLAALALVSSVAPAVAEPIEQGHHFHEVDSFVIEEFCGDLTVRVDVDQYVSFLVRTQGADGLVYFSENVQGTASITNLATGKAFTNVFTFVSKDLKVTDNGDGTLTIIAVVNGNFKTYGPDGNLLYRDTGQEKTVSLIDHGGTPTDPSDDEVIDSEIVKDTGWVFAEGRDFCTDFRALTT